MKKYQHGHDFSVGNAAFAVAAALSRHIQEVFFEFWLKNFAEFVE